MYEAARPVRKSAAVAEPATPLELRLDRPDARRALGMLAGYVTEARGVREVERQPYEERRALLRRVRGWTPAFSRC